jgi:hypothetical protein
MSNVLRNYNKNEEVLELITDKIQLPLTYELKQITEFVLTGTQMNYTETEMKWNIKHLERDEENEGYDIQILLEEHKILKYKPQFKSLIDFISKFNSPLSVLNLHLDKNGIPNKIYNQQRIWEKWMNLREGEFSELKDDKNAKVILKGGDSDFSNTIEVINNSLIYILFFPYVYNIKGTSDIKREVKIPSNLFNGEICTFSILERKREWFENMLIVEHHANGRPNNCKNIHNIYNDGLKNVADNKEFNYKNIYTASYQFSRRNGLIERCDAELYEEATEGVFSKQTYFIKLVKEK